MAFSRSENMGVLRTPAPEQTSCEIDERNRRFADRPEEGAYMAQWKTTWMRTQDIKVAPQVRLENDPKKQEELNASVKANDILMPLLVMIPGLLIAGHRRLIAAIAAGLETVPVIITDRLLSETEIRLIQLAENIHRADLNSFEKWQACVELMRLNPEWQLKDLAAHLHLDPSMVTRLLSPSKCIPAWQEALAVNKVGISDCYAASKLSETEQAELLRLKLSGASRDAIEQAGRQSRNNKPATVKLSRVKIAMPQGASVVISGKELSMPELVELLSETLKEARKATEQFDVKTFQSMMRDKARG